MAASSYKLLFLRNVWKGQHCNVKSVSSSYSSGGKTEILSENRPQNEMPLVSPTGKDSPTGGPRHRSDEHERQLYHCPVPAFSTSALRNSWTYQQSVSPGLTPTVTRKWSPLVCNELMKHPWKCTVCTLRDTQLPAIESHYIQARMIYNVPIQSWTSFQSWTTFQRRVGQPGAHSPHP